jgi:TPR repeat protein
MAKKVRFPLKMADGAQVRTLEELREHFDPESVLAYYDNGKLNTWLNDRYEESTAAKLAELDPSAADFKKRLCEALGVAYEAGAVESVDFEAVAARNRRLERLRAFTADDAILAAVDRVAFSQEDLADLLDDDISPIYLCGERFSVPVGKGGVTYIGVNKPKLDSSGSALDFIANGIVFQDVETGWDEDINDDIVIVNLIKSAANPVEAMFKLGEDYWLGRDVDEDMPEGVKWFRKAAEQGNADAMCYLGKAYRYGNGVDEDKSEAVKWYRKAAELGNAAAMFGLGLAYRFGHGVAKDKSEGDKWYRKATELGYRRSI